MSSSQATAPDHHPIDTDRLSQYLRDRLPELGVTISITQFAGGQSNPTYLLRSDSKSYVLRKKPTGKLLPTAHAIDREFLVLHALMGTDVPVPGVHLLCRDESIVGQMFYVMDYVEGRVFRNISTADLSPTDRAAILTELSSVLARLHAVDLNDRGLAAFGKGSEFLKRQIKRWSEQYYACGFDAPVMDALIEWLHRHLPATEEVSLTHGDYRLGNVLIETSRPQIAAVLDWELSTLGNPLIDLAHCCLFYRLPATVGEGIGGSDISGLGIPTEQEFVEQYFSRSGRPRPHNWEFYIVFALFRVASIDAGVYRRALNGNAADRAAIDVGKSFAAIADLAWQTAQSAKFA